ncbi:polysaccharide ABC transporter ATP-binding protein [Thermodesulfobacteriota bacterium]
MSMSVEPEKGNIKTAGKNKREVIVSATNVSKKFCKKLKRSMKYGIFDLSKNLAGSKPDSSTLRKDEFWAVRDVSFELERGVNFGIIGANGSGKTTLLRVLSGIFPPDIGRVECKGRIGALISLGAGFHPHMSAEENIFINGTILGMSRHEIKQKFNQIVEFSEIGHFLHSPLATFSSGMRVRLGFAIAIQCNPDIFFVDEVLAVGDLNFQKKCFAKMRELKESGSAVVLVSHSMNNILSTCDRVMLLHKGRAIETGDPVEIVNKYQYIQNLESLKNERLLDKNDEGVEVLDFFITQESDSCTKIQGEYTVEARRPFTIHIKLRLQEEIRDPLYALGIYTDGIRLCTLSSLNVDNKEDIPKFLNKEILLKVLVKDPVFCPGSYRVTLSLRPKYKYYFLAKLKVVGKFLVKIPEALVSDERYTMHNFIEQNTEVAFE